MTRLHRTALACRNYPAPRPQALGAVPVLRERGRRGGVDQCNRCAARRGEIRVRRAKGDRPRTAYVPAELGARLAAWVEGRDGQLFPVSARHAQRVIGKMACDAGVSASAHSLRHSLAMRIYRKTGDIGVVRAALGHASVATTVRYARCDEGAVRRAVGA